MGRYETQGDLFADSFRKIVGEGGRRPGSPRPDPEGEGPGVLPIVENRPFPPVAR